MGRHTARPRRRLHWGRLLLLLAVIGAAAFGSYWYIGADDRPLNVLIMGVDEGEARSDTMILAIADPRRGTAGLISIPRDTRTAIQGRARPEKITHAHAYGGAKLAAATTQNLLGIPVERWAEFNFDGFRALVDRLGGVEVDVEVDMHYVDPYQNLRIDLKRGRQRLDGAKALQYVRYRGDTGDIGRIGRQQKFLRALMQEALKPANLPKLPLLAREAARYTRTNLTTGEMLALATLAARLDPADLRIKTLPGTAKVLHDPDGEIWYWLPDTAATKNLLRELGAR